MSWKIQKVQGSRVTEVGSLPPHLSIAEVEITLQRLVCTDLSEQEVLSASTRHGAGGHSDWLERVGAEAPNTITYGQGEIQFVARRLVDEIQEA